MKILLLNPLTTRPITARRERYFVRAGSRWPASYTKAPQASGRYIPFPFYLAYAAALLRNEGAPLSVDVIDCVAANIHTDRLLGDMAHRRPDLIVYETTTPTIKDDLRLAAALKQAAGATIVLAGPHVSAYPVETLEDHPAIDYLLLYEYEVALCDLVRFLLRGGSLERLSGLAYRAGGSVTVQDAYRPIDPLDRLPFPARDLFPTPQRPDMYVYWDGFCQYRPAVQMHSSRGCPFRCDFCLWTQVMYRDGPYRMFSPARVVDEMEEAVGRYGAREIYFDDDDFTINKRHVLGICKEILGRGLRIPLSCMGDAIVPDEHMIDAMADAGCRGMKFGVESASPRILERLGKPVDLDHVRDVARWCTRRRIKTHATITFGLWDETRESMELSLSFVKALDVDSVQFSIASPFPGTRYFEEMKRSDRLRFREWEDFDGSRSAVVDFPNLARGEIERFCAQAASRWLFHKLGQPRWVARQFRYMARLVQGQGVSALAARARRAVEIVTKR